MPLEENMKGKIGIRSAIAVALLAAGATSGTAWAQGVLAPDSPALEFEFNSLGTASVDGTATGGTAVVYRFWANEGDSVTVDIDGPSAVDTMVSIHAPSYAVETVMDDWQGTTLDPGSVTNQDPYIQNWVISQSGYHYVAVTVSPDRVVDGGGFLALGGAGTGGFTLNVSGVTPEQATPPAGGDDTPPPSGGDDTPPPSGGDDTPPPPPPPATDEVKHVRIDVRPGARALVRLNPKWRDTIPVAILSSRKFDARTVDMKTLTFGRTGEEQSLRNCSRGFTHLNRDRRPDLVCHFENQAAAFELGDEEGVLKGMTVDGQPFEGRAMLKVVPEKRHHGHRHGKDHRKDRDDDRKGNQRHTSWWSR
jgi:hypothetical protein